MRTSVVTNVRIPPVTDVSIRRKPALLAAQRWRLILRAVRSGEAAQVAELARRFGVSEMTVRRDLAHLAGEGKLIRVHGGAFSDADEPPFAAIEVVRAEAKARIGRAAAALVSDGQTIIIDTGTTPLALARELHGRRLTVITGNLAVIEELLPEPGIELILLGGTVRRNYRSVVGVFAEEILRQVSADIAFLGTSGVRRADLAVMDTTMVEVPIKRAMIASADRSVLLADAQKFSTAGTIRVCNAADLDGVVTDATEDEPSLAALVGMGVEVVRA